MEGVPNTHHLMQGMFYFQFLWISAVLQFIAQMIVGPYNGGSPVSQSQAIPEEAGEGRETSRTGERITHGWAFKSKTNIGSDQT